METKILEPTIENIKLAADVIKEGGLVAFPTETVYGLGANALDEVAVKKVYEAKGRPSDNPMIVHISRASDIGQTTRMLSPDIVNLIDNFWPGPLTLIVKSKDAIPKVTRGGLETVGVRLPDNEIARKLIELSGVPIAAPSANISGRPSPTRVEDVIEDLDGKVDIILKGEDCRVGIESTVLDVSGDKLMILRPGFITAEQLEAAVGKEVVYDPTLNIDPREREANGEEELIPKAPGMKYKHYAPKADMLIVEGQRDKVKNEVLRLKALNEGLGNKVGVLLFEEQEFIQAAHDFFAKLRDLDHQEVDMIIAGALTDIDGVGFAVMNRMLKSAGYNIVRV
ncbi:MAG: threonylcarbamoyl-AMP synthase [Firmicutes bacterium]|nr:threonylcarbamoyl-AMP synthase [Bacillota bacterium]